MENEKIEVLSEDEIFALPCLSSSVTVAPDNKKRVKLRASFLVNGSFLSLSVILVHSTSEYTNKLFSSPLVITNESPNSFLNFDGIMILPFSSIE